MHFSSERPLTSRTRKRLEQLEDDQDLARILALEEDEKIAAKLQKDFENGIENNDYHLINSRNGLSEWKEMDGSSGVEPQMMGRNEGSRPQEKSPPKEQHQKKVEKNSPSPKPKPDQQTSSYASSPEPELAKKPKMSYDEQRVEMRPNGNAPPPQEHFPDDSDSDLDELSSRIKNHNEDSVPKNGMARRHSDELLGDAKNRSSMHQNDETSLSTSSGNLLDNTTALESEVKSLIEMIGMYHPENIELDQKLKLFVPDYIPAIGDIDPIIKVPMPTTIGENERPESLKSQEYAGFVCLDEPSATQSDPAVLDLSLRAISIQKTTQNRKIRSIRLPTVSASSHENPKGPHKALQNWIDHVADIQQKKNKSGTKSALNVVDIESLMAEWPSEIDVALEDSSIQLPTPEIDLNLKEFSQLCCNILDIPVKKSKNATGGKSRVVIEAVAVMANLYLEFKNNQHFSARV